MERVVCVFLLGARLDSDGCRAEGSCLNERHKLLGIDCLAGVFIISICFCIPVVKIPLPTSHLLLRNLDLDLLSRNRKSFLLVVCTGDVQRAHTTPTSTYLDTAWRSYLNPHSSGVASPSLVHSSRQNEQHRFPRSSDRRRAKSYRIRYSRRLREGLPAILCITRIIHARVKVGEECQLEKNDKDQGGGVYGQSGEIEGAFTGAGDREEKETCGGGE